MQGIAKIDSILATVDGVPVTLRDVILESMYYERKLTGMYSGERLYNEILKVRKTILDDIIFRHIVYNKYLKNPFEIPKQEIDRRMDIYYERIGAKNRVEFEQRAAKYGITTDELRGKVREEFAVEVII